MDYIENIDAYLNDQLSEVDKKAFEKEMEENEVLREAVNKHPIAMEAVDRMIEVDIRSMVEEHNSMDPETKAYIESDTEPGINNKTNRRSQWILGATAAVILIYLGYRFMQPGVDMVTTAETRVASVYVAPSWPTVRGEVDTIGSLINIYQSGRKSSAKDALLHMGTPESNYWLSEIYLSEFNGDSTLIFLPDHNTTVTQQQRDRLYFNRVLATLLTEDYMATRKMIEEAPSNMDNYYKERLSRLLAK